MNDAWHPEEVRWKQRFQNYRQALARLTEAVDLSRQRPLSDLEKQGLVQAFEFTHEMAWNVLKDYLEAQGFTDIVGSRGATRQAFKDGLIEDGEIWMEMIKARNQSSHTYNLSVAENIVRDVLARFHPAFTAMENRFARLKQEAD